MVVVVVVEVVVMGKGSCMGMMIPGDDVLGDEGLCFVGRVRAFFSDLLGVSVLMRLWQADGNRM
ncbi:hypothetical protein HOY80DRAFT_979700 [Tuber brumale]|nr:hypothetical protein HOY80DRAFT_979700 [Tuber brumale]